jgi:putative PIN family toxin of toxin-antitoxin system
MTLRVVYDTNVIVSAVLKPGSIPASLVALAMEGSVTLFLTEEILQEYKDVLKRPVFGFHPSAVNAFLNDLEQASKIVYPTRRVASALDEPDNRFLECAEEAKANYLVTGNKKHFPFPELKGTKIVSPAELAVCFPNHELTLPEDMAPSLP